MPRSLLVLLCTSLILKLALLIPAHETYPVRDAADYFAVAQGLYAGRGYQSLRPPLYPAALAGVIGLAAWVGGDAALTPASPASAAQPRPPVSDLDWIRLLQVLLSTASVWLVYRLGRALFDRRAGVMAAGIFAFYPPYVGYSHLLWAETLFVCLNLVWVLLLLRGVREDRLSLLASAGVVIGLAGLVRPVVFSFIPVILIWILVMRPAKGWHGSRALAQGAVFAVCAILCVAPWTLRNARVHGEFVLIAPQSGTALLFGVSENPMEEFRRAGIRPGMEGMDRERRAGVQARALLRADPAAYLQRAFGTNLPNLWMPGSFVLELFHHPGPEGYPSVPGWLGRGLLLLFVVSFVAAMLLGILGGVLAPEWRTTLLFGGLFAFATVVHTALSGNSRHRLFLMVFALIYAGFLVTRSRQELERTSPGQRLLAGGLCLAFFLILAAADYRVLWLQWQFFA